MNIAILGTGIVGRSHAEKLSELGHTVVLGTLDVAKTLAETEPDQMGTAPFPTWHADHEDIALVPFAEAAEKGELVINALRGEAALAVLSPLQSELKGKTLVDIANPLDFSNGMPPSLSISNTNSLGEEIQKALPDTQVVKSFNTTNASLQVNPGALKNADHTLFMCGNDASAKETVRALAESYGWKDIIDLGDITTARGTEMLLPVWLRLWGTLQTPTFNFKIVRE